ncbi:MAG: 2-oxoacid:ferredoxin oxidoreductase subunit gamma [Bacteroidetes bacterium]|nr:MAG: 2-oxoacid:ferredoxin oxidoreductase subunit gamma [Bacteroidota bacterium]
MNIRFTGFGGQGIILSGVIYGWAAILDNKNAIQTQSYGSSARGGACKCDVIIQDSYIYELVPSGNDILVAFSQPAFEKYKKSLLKTGILFFDSDLVNINSFEAVSHSIPATDFAFKEFGQKLFANIIMLGFFNAKTGLINPEAVEKSIKQYVPAKYADTNINAFRLGAGLI